MKIRKNIARLLAVAGIGLMAAQSALAYDLEALIFQNLNMEGNQVSFSFIIPDESNGGVVKLEQRIPPSATWNEIDEFSDGAFPTTPSPRHFYPLDMTVATNEFRLVRYLNGQIVRQTGVVKVLVPPVTPQVGPIHVDYEYSMRWIRYDYRARLNTANSVHIERGPSPNGPWEKVPPAMSQYIHMPTGWAHIAIAIDPYMIPQYTRLVINGTAYASGGETDPWNKILSKQPYEEVNLGTPVVDTVAGTVTFNDGQCITHGSGSGGYLMRSVDNLKTWQFAQDFSGGYPVSLPSTGPYVANLDPNAEHQYFRIQANMAPVETYNYVYTAYSDTVVVPERNGNIFLEMEGNDVTIIWRSDYDTTYRVQQIDNLISGSWIDASGDITATSTMCSWSTNNPPVAQRYYRVITVSSPGQAQSMAAMDGEYVGYSMKDLSAGKFEMVAPQFLEDEPGEISLGDAFSGLNDQATVYMWTGSGYDIYTYFNGSGWFDAGFVPANDVVVEQGDAIWLKDGGTGHDAIMSGTAPSASSVTNALQAGFNMVANPYPVSIELDDIPLAVLSDQDMVYIWNGISYDIYTYIAGFGWFDAFFEPSNNVQVDVGQGFWLKTLTDGDLIFNKMY